MPEAQRCVKGDGIATMNLAISGSLHAFVIHAASPSFGARSTTPSAASGGSGATTGTDGERIEASHRTSAEGCGPVGSRRERPREPGLAEGGPAVPAGRGPVRREPAPAGRALGRVRALAGRARSHHGRRVGRGGAP